MQLPSAMHCSGITKVNLTIELLTMTTTSISVKLVALVPLVYLWDKDYLGGGGGEGGEGEIRGSKPDGRTKRESILGERNCREREEGRGQSESCDIVSEYNPVAHLFNDLC